MLSIINKHTLFLIATIPLIAVGCEEEKTETGPIPEMPFNFVGTWTIAEWRQGDFWASTHTWHVYEDGNFLYSAPDGHPDREPRYYKFCDNVAIDTDTVDIFHTNYNNNSSTSCRCDIQEAWTIRYKGRDKFELTDCYGDRPKVELIRQSLIP